MALEKRQFETLKFTFSSDDIRELGQSMARETQGVYDLEKRKKELDAELAANIKAANGRVESLTTKINNGYEMREVEVLVLLDEPKMGLKRIIRVDNNEHLRDEAMTFDEMQRGFGFDKE
jgi:hypothetical protein